MWLRCTGKKIMSDLLQDNDMNDLSNIIVKNPKVDAEKVAEARKLIQILRDQGISQSGYNLIPPFRRQMYVESGYEKEES